MQPPPGFAPSFAPRGFRGGRGYSHPPRGHPFSPRGHQQASFPHLRSVPPPPIGSALRPARFEPPAGPSLQPLLRPNNGFNNHGFPGPGVQRGRGGRGREQGFRGRGQARGSRQGMTVPAVRTVVKPMCDTCDRAFPSEAELAQHTAQHVTCDLEGCKFSAHPKVVAKHVEMQHQTGLYSRLAMGLEPEEVSRWREERRKSFPTRANIEKKMQATRERQARGERIHEPRGRFNRRGKWNQRPLQPAAQQHVNFSRDMTVSNINPGNLNAESTPVSPITDNTEEVKPLLPSALANLADSYCTSSDSEEAPEEIVTVRCHEDFSQDPPVEKVRAVSRPSAQQRHTEELRKQPSLRQRYNVHRRPPTLLQKLLETEIRHERNLVLQCVRHVVQNNFFQ